MSGRRQIGAGLEKSTMEVSRSDSAPCLYTSKEELERKHGWTPWLVEVDTL